MLNVRRDMENLRQLVQYEMMCGNEFIGEYVVYNAPIFLYPFAATAISSLSSILMIVLTILFLYALFIAFNPIFLILLLILWFVSGYTGSRFNKKALFKEAVNTFSKKLPPYSREHFHSAIANFHEKYYQSLEPSIKQKDK